jgi:hypothetical protein
MVSKNTGKPQETQQDLGRNRGLCIRVESRTLPAGHGTELRSPRIVRRYPIYWILLTSKLSCAPTSSLLAILAVTFPKALEDKASILFLKSQIFRVRVHS